MIVGRADGLGRPAPHSLQNGDAVNASDLLGVPASRSSSTHKRRIYGRGRVSPAQAKTEDAASRQQVPSLLQSRRPNGLRGSSEPLTTYCKIASEFRKRIGLRPRSLT
jgi:hypothetical protein